MTSRTAGARRFALYEFIGFFLHTGGTMGMALFIGVAMAIMIVTIGGFGPHTLNRRLEEISR